MSAGDVAEPGPGEGAGDLPDSGRRRALVVAYDGTDFSGWQVQPGVVTVQGELEAALGRLARAPVRVGGSGRTDAGVHALGQVAHFDDPLGWDPDRLRMVLNTVLPPAIRVRRLLGMPDVFHARRWVLNKTYVYQLHFSREGGGRRAIERSVPPLRRQAFHAVRNDLDLGAMRLAAAHLVGTHDFTAVSKTMPAARGSVRSVASIRLLRIPQGLRIVVTGRGFLYGMVRMISGLLVEVGEGRRAARDVPELLAAADRSRAPVSLPACGLVLWKVRYNPVPGVGAGTLRLLS